MTWLHVENGKITEGWDAWNYEGLFALLSGRETRKADNPRRIRK